ncbi:hypothetical protein AB0M43_22845 [Longispora sp. NPDC051575]|uniref:hypothetical protein n=1 Tax=Longispora sp. NPDC051575 TaxID=3154943 RepID=UPI003413F000
MSLCVHVFALLPDGGSAVLDEGPDVPDAAGAERTRHTLWGSSAVADLGLGLRFLPTLAWGDLWVGPDGLDGLAADCAAIRDRLAAVAAATGYTEEFVADRVGNIAAAVDRARGVEGGGVVIW